MQIKQPRVAIIGASGIGKNHARWFHGHGARVVAIGGTSHESLTDTRNLLRDSIDFEGSIHRSIEAMLDEEEPDIVCVSSPPQFHFEHASLALESGAAVLCEKPLTGIAPEASEYSILSGVEAIREARELVELASQKGAIFGAQMQYGFALNSLRELWKLDETVRELSFALMTKNARPGRAANEVWLDLSPHPLSVLQKMGAQILWEEGAQCTIETMRSAARFRVQLPRQSEPCAVNIEVGVEPNVETPRRVFSANGRDVEYSMSKDTKGNVSTHLRRGEEEIVLPDLVDMLIGNFIKAWRGEEELKMTGEDGAQNVEWQWKLLDAAHRES